MKPTRADILNMAVLVGMSITEALGSSPGLIFDMLELKARQNGWKKNEVD
jgi:hypothetical protein